MTSITCKSKHHKHLTESTLAAVELWYSRMSQFPVGLEHNLSKHNEWYLRTRRSHLQLLSKVTLFGVNQLQGCFNFLVTENQVLLFRFIEHQEIFRGMIWESNVF